MPNTGSILDNVEKNGIKFIRTISILNCANRQTIENITNVKNYEMKIELKTIDNVTAIYFTRGSKTKDVIVTDIELLDMQEQITKHFREKIISIKKGDSK